MVAASFRLFDSMRLAFALLLTVAPITAAAAQSESVTVNSMGVVSGPAAAYGDGLVLIDPGTGQPRVLPPLLQPWQNSHSPIKLRPPHKQAKTQPSSDSFAAVPQEPKPEPSVAPKPKKQRAIASSQTPSLGELPPAPKKVVAAPPQPAPALPPPPASSKPVKQASLEPSKPLLPRPVAGAKRDSITFSPNASDPSGSAVSTVRALAGGLNDALNDGTARVQLMAYAGQRGEKTSDTRRLSLKRALVVRQLLIDDGIPAERIDVFALGGVDDSGALDRVDVLVKR